MAFKGDTAQTSPKFLTMSQAKSLPQFEVISFSFFHQFFCFKVVFDEFF